MKYILLITIFYCCSNVYAQTLEENKNLGQYPNPRMLTVFNDKLYFSAIMAGKGNELYTCDSNFKISPVNEILSGSGDGVSFLVRNKMVVINDTLYFAGDDGIKGEELWGLDVFNNPFLAKEVRYGPNSSYPNYLTANSDMIFFSAVNDTFGRELWSYQPTYKKVSVFNINPGIASSNPDWITSFNSKIYFVAENSILGRELFEYNPITDTFQCVIDLMPGTSSSNPFNLTVINGKLYFIATSVINGTELYTLDSSGQINCITNIAAGNYSSFSELKNGGIIGWGKYVYMYATNDGLFDYYQLYRYDTSTKLTSMVYKFSSTKDAEIVGFSVYHSRLYFGASDSNYKYWLWCYDGINDPYKIGQINLSTDQTVGMAKFVQFADWLYFSASGPQGFQLYRFNDKLLQIENVESKISVNVYPNPIKEQANFKITVNQQVNYILHIRDIYGRGIINPTILNLKSGENLISISMDNLQVGNYFYSISDAQSQLLNSGIIIKD